MYYIIAIIALFIILFAIYQSQNVEGFWNRESLLPIPIPPPKNYPQYVDPNYQVNQYMYNTQLAPYTPSYLNEVVAQQVQLRPWLYSSRNFPTYYPNYQLPAQVIGCGGRRGACIGGSENAIANVLPPINISDRNIAPVNLTVRGFDGGIQQLGTIERVFGDENAVLPLFGRKVYNNEDRWQYFVKTIPFGAIQKVYKKGKCGHYNDSGIMEALGTNDEVYIAGNKNSYRVTMYDQDVPQYLGVF